MKIVTCRPAHTAVAMLGILLHEAVKAHVLHISSRRLNGIWMVLLHVLKCLTERVYSLIKLFNSCGRMQALREITARKALDGLSDVLFLPHIHS